MNDTLRKRLTKASMVLALGTAGAITAHWGIQHPASHPPSAALLLAMELGAHYESSGRHIGKPYVDRSGKGQPLTVCNGVTGSGVIAGRYYSAQDCKRLELPRYQSAERAARDMFVHWARYNVWVRASMIDMIYNLGAQALKGSELLRLANAGDLIGACAQMPRWVRGTIDGRSAVLPGLVDRRESTRELCEQWGRNGHFSANLMTQEGRK